MKASPSLQYVDWYFSNVIHITDSHSTIRRYFSGLQSAFEQTIREGTSSAVCINWQVDRYLRSEAPYSALGASYQLYNSRIEIIKNILYTLNY